MDEDFQNIIVRMPNWIGDAVMATPIIADIRSRWPQANITAMCQGNGIASLLLANPNLNEIFTFIKPQEFWHRFHQRDLITRLRQGKYDVGILLTNSFSSAWWLWRGDVKRRIGYNTNGRGFLLSDRLSLPEDREKQHLIITYKQLLEPLGIPLSDTEPQLFITADETVAAKELLTNCQIPAGASVVGINPGAAFGSAKCWPPDRFRAVIEKLISRPKTYVVCFGDRSGADLVDEICRGMPKEVINLAGSTSLRELIALIAQCTVFLSNDSGPMHIAAALKVPLVALFGSTNEVATGPYHHGTVIHKHVECSPCYRRVCPIDFRCMKRIEVEEVYAALIKYLPQEN